MSFISEHLKILKNAWMASHILEAEFPTPLSQEGLSLYQQTDSEKNINIIDSPIDLPHSDLSFYLVDCHPLTIRYAIVFASHWKDESARQAIIEFITQIMLEPDSNAELYVGYWKGKPATCGMIFTNEENGKKYSLVSDVEVLSSDCHKDLQQQMTHYLLHIAQQNAETVVLEQ